MIRVEIESYTHPAQDSPFLRNVSFSVTFGKISCLLGTSAAGKTTVLHVLLGTASGRLKGRVCYCPSAEESLSPLEACSRQLIGVLLHGPSLVPWLSVRTNLLLPAALAERSRHRPRGTPEVDPEHDIEAGIPTVLGALNLDMSVLNQFPDTLSLGTRQRVCLARAFLHSPRYLLLDEAFVGLDAANALDISSALRRFVTERQVACLLVTHDIEKLIKLADDCNYLPPGGPCRPIAMPPTPSVLIDWLRADLDRTVLPQPRPQLAFKEGATTR